MNMDFREDPEPQIRRIYKIWSASIKWSTNSWCYTKYSRFKKREHILPILASLHRLSVSWNNKFLKYGCFFISHHITLSEKWEHVTRDLCLPTDPGLNVVGTGVYSSLSSFAAPKTVEFSSSPHPTLPDY